MELLETDLTVPKYHSRPISLKTFFKSECKGANFIKKLYPELEKHTLGIGSLGVPGDSTEAFLLY